MYGSSPPSAESNSRRFPSDTTLGGCCCGVLNVKKSFNFSPNDRSFFL